jgi:dipeptidyl aminopeptidase/acylaminoacyl peptidase
MSNDKRIMKTKTCNATLPMLRHLIIRHSFELRHSSFVICLLLGLLGGIGTAFAEKRAITEKDLFDFVWIGDPQISPDGSRVAFVRITVNDKKEGYNTSIWSVPVTGGEEPHQLTKGNHDSAPRWSPDGKYLLFLRATEKNGKPKETQLALLPMDGGDSFVFTDLPKGANNPVWSPDGKTIAFTSDTNREDLAKQEKEKSKEQESKKTPGEAPNKPTPTATPGTQKAGEEPERESDVRVVSRAEYRRDNEGYSDPKHPSHIWLVNPPRSAEEKVKPRQLTTGRFDEENPMWSKDGSQIYFTSNTVDEPYYELPKTEVYSVAIAGGKPIKITTIDLQVGGFGPGGALSLSPNGKQVAFTASTTRPITSYTQPDLWVLDLLPNAKPRNLTTNFDFDAPGFVIGDSASPRAGGQNKPIWTPDGTGLIQVYAKEGKSTLALFDVPAGDADPGSAGVHDLTSGNQCVISFRASPDTSKLVCTISTPTRVNDLFALDRATPDASLKQLTHLNDELFSKLNLTEPEEIWYDSFDGKRIEAWVQKPPNFDPRKKYPLILNIHGGPHVAYGYIFMHEFQWMAAKGYVVLYPNPRGSTSYGQEFGNVIQYHYPGDDYKDLMAGVDELIKRGYIDDKKLGVTGGSGGGLLTNWVVGQTNRFVAGVAQRDIASWDDWWYTADFTQFQPIWFKGAPFEDLQEYRGRSPINYINNVKTPMMFILGEADHRTPPGAGGEQMFRALKFRKIPTVMVRFPDESHELSRSGQPWHRVERLQHIVGWFDRWLMGASKPEYEVAQGEAPTEKGQIGQRK